MFLFLQPFQVFIYPLPFDIQLTKYLTKDGNWGLNWPLYFCLLTCLVVDPQEQQQGTTKSTLYFPFTDFEANGKYLDNESFITFTTQHNIWIGQGQITFSFFWKHNGRPDLTKHPKSSSLAEGWRELHCTPLGLNPRTYFEVPGIPEWAISMSLPWRRSFIIVNRTYSIRIQCLKPILSCAGLGSSAWFYLLSCFIFSNDLWHFLCTRLGFIHPTTCIFFLCICN